MSIETQHLHVDDTLSAAERRAENERREIAETGQYTDPRTFTQMVAGQKYEISGVCRWESAYYFETIGSSTGLHFNLDAAGPGPGPSFGTYTVSIPAGTVYRCHPIFADQYIRIGRLGGLPATSPDIAAEAALIAWTDYVERTAERELSAAPEPTVNFLAERNALARTILDFALSEPDPVRAGHWFDIARTFGLTATWEAAYEAHAELWHIAGHDDDEIKAMVCDHAAEKISSWLLRNGAGPDWYDSLDNG